MSSRAIPRSDCLLYRYRPAPIRAAIVPCCTDRCFCRRQRQVIGDIHSTVDTLRHTMVKILQRIGTSDQRGKIPIPIALRSTPTPAKPPAVSSPEACPTPAH
jgi:hypothetical protein